MKNLSIAVLLSMLVMTVPCLAMEKASQAKKWPAIKPAQIKTFVTSENAKVVLDIFSKKKPTEKLYVLRCNDLYSHDLAVDEDEYYGMFQCHLLSTSIKSGGLDLLAGEHLWDMNKSWNTRGVFKYEQLVGPCKNNPEFGLHREFNMRGMKLELTISNFSAPPIVDVLTEKVKFHYSFDFEAKVIPNKKATSKYTYPSAKEYCGGEYELNDKGEAVYFETGN
jgi:hypothetical protein